MSLQFIDLDIGEVTVISLTGRITLGRGTEVLRQAVSEVMERGRHKLILDFDEVMYVDSSGLGTLMQVRTTVLNAGGNLKLMRLRDITRDLIQVTRLNMVFEVFDDEDKAVQSFEPAAA